MATLPYDVPADWEAALARACAVARVAVVGPTDSGKSTFLHLLAARRAGLRLLDLDPGQKMIGPPGTASVGLLDPVRPERFVFLGSTGVGSFRILEEAAARLVPAHGPFAVNTPGYVRGPGARLQAMLLRATRPDLVVAIGEVPALPADVWIAPAPAARRKSQASRRSIRQAAFDRALHGARPFGTPAAMEPGPMVALETAARPVCALADAAGEDMVLGIATALGQVVAPPPPRPPASLRLGSMWAEPADGGWRLLDRLAPAFDTAVTAP